MVLTSRVVRLYGRSSKELRRKLVKYTSMIMSRGPLLPDDGEAPIGSIFLLDVPDMDSARAFLEKAPFYSNGVYQEVNFHRWRFGRVMDHFK